MDGRPSYAAVEQTSDAGMFEPGEDLALGVEARELADRFEAQQLECAALRESGIGAQRRIDFTHAAAAGQFVDAPGADARAGGK